MQFCILLIGILVFAYYQFHTPPLFFNNVEVAKIENSQYSDEYANIIQQHEAIGEEKKIWIEKLVTALKTDDTETIDASREALLEKNKEDQVLRKEVETLLQKNNPDAELNDNNYIFLSFVTSTFPKGLIGLLIAIIFLASMGATASAINSLSSTTVVDIYKRFINKKGSDRGYLNASRLFTLVWGII